MYGSAADPGDGRARELVPIYDRAVPLRVREQMTAVGDANTFATVPDGTGLQVNAYYVLQVPFFASE